MSLSNASLAGNVIPGEQAPQPSRLGSERVTQVMAALGFLITVMVAGVALRGPDLLLNMPFNPDEAELLAQGRRAQELLFPPYESFTTTTHALLWPMFMGALGKIGIPLGFVTAHILATAAYVLLAFFFYLIAAHHLGWKSAFLLSLPSTLWILALTGDFLSLSSELLPMLIIATSVLIFALPRTSPTVPRLLSATTTLGIVPWAKPQLAPVALSIALVMMLASGLCTRRGLNSATPIRSGMLALAGVGFLLPTLVVLLILIASGNFENFYDETVLYQISYVSERDTLGGESPNFLIRPSYVASFVISFAPAMLWALAAFATWGSGSSRRDSWVMKWQVVVWLLPPVAAFATLWLAFPLFDHYANILFVSFFASGAMVIATASWWVRPANGPGRVPFTVGIAFGVALLLVALSTLPRTWDNGLIWRDGNVRFSSQDVSSETLVALCPPRSRVLVWGWASELYSWFDWMPASRFVNSWQLAPLINVDRHRQVLKTELVSNPPDCIVDANGDGFFGTRLLPGGFVETMPGISALLNSCYEYGREQLTDQRFVAVWRNLGRC